METLHVIGIVIAILAGFSYFKRAIPVRAIIKPAVAEEYDYVSVGGGSAGCVLASRLSEDEDKSVLLLEAGPSYEDKPDIDIPSKWSSLMKTDYTWAYYTTPQAHSGQGLKNKKGFMPRGRVLGGTSATNAMQYTRGSPAEYDDWAANGCTGWSYTDVLPYFLKSEDIQIPELKSSKYHGSGGPLAVSSSVIPTQLYSRILKACKELGYETTDYNSDDINGFGQLQLTTRNGVRASTNKAFLEEAMQRTNLGTCISVESFVTKINIENERATGVWFIKDNRKYYVRARKEVIVSAGAINSPQLLMLSGIGPKDHLRDLGIPVIADLPVGQNLQDHFIVLGSSKISKPLSLMDESRSSWTSELQYSLFGTGPIASTGNEIAGYVNADKSKSDIAQLDIFVVFQSYLIPAVAGVSVNLDERYANEYFHRSNVHGVTARFAKSHPKSRGTLQLHTTDPFDHPLIDPQYLSQRSDVETMISAMRIWEKFVAIRTMQDLGANLDDMRLSFCSHHEFRSDDYWECFIRHLGRLGSHHSGTCKMGSDTDPTAVVDPELRVRGIKALRVVDTSIFPNVTAGNTHAPVIMVAEKAADMIRGKYTVQHLRRDAS